MLQHTKLRKKKNSGKGKLSSPFQWRKQKEMKLSSWIFLTNIAQFSILYTSLPIFHQPSTGLNTGFCQQGVRVLSGSLDVWMWRAVAHLRGNPSIATWSYISTQETCFIEPKNNPSWKNPKDHQVHLLAPHKTTQESNPMSTALLKSFGPWALPWGACSVVPCPLSSGEEPFPNIQPILHFIFWRRKHNEIGDKRVSQLLAGAG